MRKANESGDGWLRKEWKRDDKRREREIAKRRGEWIIRDANVIAWQMERKPDKDREVKRRRCWKDRETDYNSNGREWKREMLSFLSHGWGSTAAGTLLLQIQSDLQLNQPWHSGYRAGRDQTHQETRWNTPRKVWKKREKNVDTAARKGNYTQHDAETQDVEMMCPLHDYREQMRTKTMF